MRRRGFLGVLAAAVVALAVFAALGRSEGRHAADVQLDGIDAQWTAVGKRLDGPTLDGFRHAATFDCLEYRKGAYRFAHELCFDGRGRLIEAMQRTHGFQVWTVRFEPDVARVTVDRRELDRLLLELGVDKVSPYAGDSAYAVKKVVVAPGAGRR